MKDESGEQFVAYFLPTDETMQKRDKDKTDGKFELPVLGGGGGEKKKKRNNKKKKIYKQKKKK